MQIARTSQRTVQGQNMIGLVIKLVPRVLRALGTLPPPMLPLPRRGLVQRPVRCPRAPRLPVDRPLLRVAVVCRAGVLALLLHLTTVAGKVRMSLLAVTRVMAPAATKIVVNASLPPATLPMAAGATEALAVAAQVDLVALGAPMGEEARFLGNGTISIGSF